MRKCCFAIILLALYVLPTFAAEYTTPRALNIGDTYVLVKDAHTGDEATTQPKTDANNGLNGDNAYYQRYNVARAHNDYWYTSKYQEPGEPDPAGPQWVDYKPPLNILNPGRYRINAQYRNTGSRANYNVPYIVTKGDGTTTTIYKNQSVGTDYITFDLGEFELGSTGWVRVQDPGADSITFNRMKFTFLAHDGPDTEAPSVPAGVQAVAKSSSSVQITWAASTDNRAVAGYKIFRNGSLIGTSTATDYLNTGLSTNTTYSYTVAAYDAANNESAQSSPPVVAATPILDTVSPSTPTGVLAVALSPVSVQVLWTASTDNVGVTGYKVFRNGSQVGTATTTSYTDSTVMPLNTYSYTVSAFDADENNSGLSSPPAMASTPEQVPPTYGSVDMGSTDVNNLLSRVSSTDGYTLVTTAGGLECRKQQTASATYMYFGVDDSFIHNSDETTYVEVNYYDDLDASVTMILEYDSAYSTDEYGQSGQYKQGGGIAFSNTGKWKTGVFTLPRSKFANRQNSGADFRIYLGATGNAKIDTVRVSKISYGDYDVVEKDLGPDEVYHGLSHPQAADGDTILAEIGGRDCRKPAETGDTYFYFNVSDAIIYDGSTSTAYLKVEYYDSPGGQIRPEYDSTSGIYTEADTVTFSGTNTWQEAIWELTNVKFANSQAVSGDLRLFVGTSADVHIDRVTVSRIPFIPDTEEPTVPMNVVATAQSPSSIMISWSPSIDNVRVSGYKVFRNTAQVGTTGTTSYTDTGLQPETSYSYRVSAYDSAGNTSEQSDMAVATTIPDTVPPSFTQHPQATDVCEGETATFTVVASGSGTLNYQWQKDGADLSNAGHYSGVNTATLTISNADNSDVAGYRCVVTSTFGTATSNAAALTVLDCTTPVSVSSDGHWLEFRGRKVLLIGDSITQGWMECGTNFNQTAYVDALASRGINMLMLWSYIGITDQVGDPRIGYNAPEIWPWVKSGGVFNLNQFNDAYFNRLRSLVEYCNSKDIVVLITIHDGWTKSRFPGHPFNAALGGSLTDKAQYVELHSYTSEMPTTYNSGWTRQQKHQYWLERFCDRLIQATGDQSNVIYEMFNEGEWYNQTNLANFQKHFLNVFKARTNRVTMVNGDHISGTNFRNIANCDIISYHMPNWTSSSNALEFFNHYASAFNGTPVKPFYFSEPVPEYQGDSNLNTALMRMMWGTVLGGAGFVVQNDTSWGFDPNTDMAAQSTNMNIVLDREGHCARFFNDSGVNFGSMSPQGSRSSTGVCLAETGQEYVVYTQSSSFTVNLSGTIGSLVCRFYNPRTGVFQPTFYRSAGGIQAFTTPGSGDWVLHVTTMADFESPSVPMNVTAMAQSETSIQINWTASTDNIGVTGYRIYRNGTEVGTSVSTSYSDTGLQPRVTYSYTVAAYDAAGNLSAQSSPPAAATTPDNTVPSIPTNVQATAQSETSVQVTWTASTDNVGVTGYKIYRNGSEVGTSPSNSFTDTELQAATTYSYRVAAYDAVGNNSAQSTPPAVVTTQDNTAPSVPTNVQATSLAPTSVSVTWTASTDNVGVTGYKVYRNGALAGSPAGTAFTDVGLDPNTSYSYKVAARDAAGNESAQSAAAVVTTPEGHTIAGSKMLRDDVDPVFLLSKIVSAVFDDCIYIKEPDSPIGIKVVPGEIPAGMFVGKTVDVEGVMKTASPTLERYVSGTVTMK